MKNKLIVSVVVIIAIMLICFLGAYIWISAPVHDNVSFPANIIVYFLRGLLEILSNPFLILFAIVAYLIGYYFYDNFIRKKEELKLQVPNEVDNSEKYYQQNHYATAFTYIGIVATIFVSLVIFYIMLSLTGDPGHDEGLGYVVIMLIPFILFYPPYFIFLSIQYSRKKSNMLILDKIMFYFLLVCFIALATFIIPKVIKLI